jgi:hypothetical protein
VCQLKGGSNMAVLDVSSGWAPGEWLGAAGTSIGWDTCTTHEQGKERG